MNRVDDDFRTIAVVIVRNEAAYISDWILYHLAIGVRHIVVLDHESNDEIREVLTKFIAGGVVTYIFWPVRSGQIDGYNYISTIFGKKCEWLGFIDIDEYVVLHKHNNINEYLDSTGGDQVLIPWRNFGYGGHRSTSGATDLETFFWAERNRPGLQVQVKHFVRAEKISWVTAHFSFLEDGRTVLADKTASHFTHIVQNPTFQGAQINHYSTRSFIENEIRLRKGQVDGGTEKRLATFTEINKQNSSAFDYDDTILRHFEAFDAQREKWMPVSERPHRYGAMKNLKSFRFWNNVPFYFCKSYGNYLLSASVITHGSPIELFQLDSGGQPRLIWPILHETGLESVVFSVPSDDNLPYFSGTIHHADFTRRFDFICRALVRKLVVHGSFEIKRSMRMEAMFAYFHLEVLSETSITLKIDNIALVSRKMPMGKQAGFIYFSDYVDTKCGSVHIDGSCTVYELAFGGLP